MVMIVEGVVVVDVVDGRRCHSFMGTMGPSLHSLRAGLVGRVNNNDARRAPRRPHRTHRSASGFGMRFSRSCGTSGGRSRPRL